MKLEFLEPYVTYLAYTLVGLILLYIRTYLKERAKISVLKSQNEKLLNQSESIKAVYNKELEEVKKDHQLEISKRKHQYESKKEQYINFFKLIDEFSGSYNLEMQKKMIPIIKEFNTNFINGDIDQQTISAAKFSNDIQVLMLEIGMKMTRVKEETNTIRMIGSESIRNSLILLEAKYEELTTASSEMLTAMCQQLIEGDQNGLVKAQEDIKIISKDIIVLKNQLIEQMRIELDEI